MTALLEPATIDGLVYASSMVILHAARHRLPVPRLARAMLALGIAASLAVNVAQGWSHGLVGAAAAAWPAVALVGSYELLAWMIRTTAGGGPDRRPGPDEPVCTDQADHQGGPVRESTGPREPRKPTVPDQPPRRQPMTSMPPRSPPTAPASWKASRCPSASWQHHSVRPHGGGRATGWPKPSRNQSPVNRECTGRHPRQTAPTSEQCVGAVTRHVHLHLNSRRSSVTRHAQSTRRLHRPLAGVGMLAVPAPCHRHSSRGMVGLALVTDGDNSAETWREIRR